MKRILVVALLAGACTGTGEKGNDTATAVAAVPVMPSHVNPDVKKLLADSSGDPDAGEVAEILGYNDEQKLQRDASGRSFGPVVRLYAMRRDPKPVDYRNGVMVAVVEVEPFASIPPAYRHLEILPSPTDTRIYCVFLQRRLNPAQPWAGGLSLAAGGRCSTPASFRLNVDSQAVAGYETPDDFPSYAVRLTEGKSGFPSLAVRCYTAVCEIGNPANGSRKSSGVGNGKAAKVKPWHDDQEIAVPASGGGFERGPSVSITPVENLAKLSAEFRAPNGVQTATIKVFGKAPAGDKYKDWGLVDDGLTEVWVRVTSAGVWEMQLRTPATPYSTRWLAISRSPHKAGLVPGTARWKWDPADEGIWVACDQGCCETSGGFGALGRGRGDSTGRGRGSTP